MGRASGGGGRRGGGGAARPAVIDFGGGNARPARETFEFLRNRIGLTPRSARFGTLSNALQQRVKRMREAGASADAIRRMERRAEAAGARSVQEFGRGR